MYNYKEKLKLKKKKTHENIRTRSLLQPTNLVKKKVGHGSEKENEQNSIN